MTVSLYFNLPTENLDDEHDDKPKENRDKLEETWDMFLSLSVENLKHDHVQQSSRRQAL